MLAEITNPETIEIIQAMEHLDCAWSLCGERNGPAFTALAFWHAYSPAILNGSDDAARSLRRAIDRTCPGLLPAAAIYANHVEAGWYCFDEEPRVRALFVKEMGRDPFIPAR